ncbi:NADPH-dependent FMN reductase [Kribbella deserti]|uniref:NADPH-dependent FMN reductase n=1 Tax=Kribbella deserti TaxID=1926257 RepID=A0ABV6QL25_9ACTN
MTVLRLAVLCRSLEPIRFGGTATAWFARQVERREDFKADVIDLQTTPLPELPGRIDQADAIVVVAPEYNHAYPGDLKTAIDAVREPWAAKPVAFLTYGGRSRGLRAAEQLRLVFAELHAVAIREGLGFHDVPGTFADGEPIEPGTNQAAGALLDRLAWWARALREARAVTPYEL